MEDLQEVPALAAVGKGLAVAGKAVAKGVAVAAKAGAKAGGAAAKGGAKVASTTAKGGAKAAKGATKTASKTSKPVSRQLTRRNIKNPKYRNADGSFNKAKYDADKGATTTKKGGGRPPSSKIANSGKKTVDPSKNTTTKKPESTDLPDNSSIDKKAQDTTDAVQDKEARDKKVQDTNTTDAIKDGAKEVGKRTKRYIGRVSSAFGTTSFAKEGITFKEYLNKL